MSNLTRKEALAIGVMIVAFVITLIWTLVRLAYSASSHGITFYDAPATQPLPHPSQSGVASPQPVEASRVEQNAASAQPLVVHVAGAVRHPGVYRLPAGARYDDAIRMAGGAIMEANTDAINLAAPIEDGIQIYLPTRQQHPEGGAEIGSSFKQTEYKQTKYKRTEHKPTGHKMASTSSSEPSSGRAGREPKSRQNSGGNGVVRSGGKLTDPGQGTVNINTASAEELQRIPGIGPSMATRILNFRQELQKGGTRFQSPEDLLEVSGIGEKKFEKMRPFIRVQ